MTKFREKGRRKEKKIRGNSKRIPGRSKKIESNAISGIAS